MELESVVLSGIGAAIPRSTELDGFWKDLTHELNNVTDHCFTENANEIWIQLSRNIQASDSADSNTLDTDVFSQTLGVLTELTHAALLDAGVNPGTLQGTRTGVLVAPGDEGEASSSATLRLGSSSEPLEGSTWTMLAKQLSSAFVFQDQNDSTDRVSTCYSGFEALKSACLRIESKQLERAIVAFVGTFSKSRDSNPGSNLEASPAGNGELKNFPQTTGSEMAVVVLYLCRKDAAKRSYATIVQDLEATSRAHIIFKPTPTAEVQEWRPNIPVLINVSGRTSSSVLNLLSQLESHSKDLQSLAGIFHEIVKSNVPQSPSRGTTLYDGHKFQSRIQDSGAPDRPIWFVFSGVGCQWMGMTRDMNKFKVFRNSVTKSAEVLRGRNIDLWALLDSLDPGVTDEVVNACLLGTVVQLALVDLMTSIGVCPEGYIGNSTGEMAIAYADGCLNQEQALLVSIFRPMAMKEFRIPEGRMAVVWLTWEEALRRSPPGIYPAIHNSKTIVIVAGPPEPIRAFIKELNDEGTFAKEVRAVPFSSHTEIVRPCAKLLGEMLEPIIPDPKRRSRKWISTCFPDEGLDPELGAYASSGYFITNLVQPVTFYGALLKIPEGAIVVELDPQCCLLSILEKSLHPSTTCLGLMKRTAEDNAWFFLSSLGELFLEGANFDASSLYEPVEFPLGPETPMISPWIVC